ncbi:hypothetical protein ACCS91_33445 [Rhizobium ruizarguesonis]|uniref:hypothetical protein n=1 Tax=Rhizobium ruizarguesonis TaxID=2081791 RepID=UPI001639A025|nr:hypothetical protein [Rhizobium ruizarguesonis]MBC2806547.1 hypothetical protein [Rhizobium ruizarguesonis]
MAGYYQEYETFRLVVDEALGGGGGSQPKPNESDAIQSFDQLAKAFADVGGTLG